MDYKYIEQLLDRYWDCTATEDEERILRTFFNTDDVPSELMKYKGLFEYQEANKTEILDDSFDDRIMSRINQMPVVKARRITLTRRLRPLYRAAAVVAIVLTLGNAAQQSFHNDSKTPLVDYNYNNYKDSYSDPKTAFEEASQAMKTLSKGMNANTAQKDSILQEVENAEQRGDIQ